MVLTVKAMTNLELNRAVEVPRHVGRLSVILLSSLVLQWNHFQPLKRTRACLYRVDDNLYKSPTSIIIIYIWSIMSNPYLAQPLKNEIKSHVTVMIRSLYNLKSPYNSIDIYVHSVGICI